MANMFERFTDRARRTMVLAQDNARSLKHNYLGTEHLLLGLLQESGIAARALDSLGISHDRVTEQIVEIIGTGKKPISGPPPFTPRAKNVIELSFKESLQLGHDYIGTEHLLLGIVREGDGVAAQILAKLAGDLGKVRHKVLELISRGEPEAPPRADPHERDRSALRQLRSVRPDGAIAKALGDLGTSLEALIDAIERRIGEGNGKEN